MNTAIIVQKKIKTKFILPNTYKLGCNVTYILQSLFFSGSYVV